MHPSCGRPSFKSALTKYLEIHNRQVLDNIYKYYSTESGQDLWSKFEENLANLDKGVLLDYLSEYLPEPSSDDFRDRDWGAADIESDTVLSSLTSELRNEFKQFIIEASEVEIDHSQRLQIDNSAKFISFNYTSTLESKYLIPCSSILYIHGKACDGQPIVLGHATDPDMFLDEPITVKPPEDISEGDLELWYEEMSSQHDPIYEGLVSNVNGYFLTSFKDTHRIIEENESYFEALANIDEVLIYGHSMSDVDWPYLEKVFENVATNCKWVVSYFNESDKNNIECAVSCLGVMPENCELIRLDNIKVAMNENNR